MLDEARRSLHKLPIDQQVERAPRTGGHQSAAQTLEHFLAEGLPQYAEHRNQPEREVTSGLSPYLRWGHVSSHLIVHRLLDRYDWTPGDLSPENRGRRSGWWGLDENAEAFLDQLITWRELGCNLCVRRDDYHRFDSLPGWARKTLQNHAGDPRPYLYSPEDLAAARTHDLLWNAAQRQLVREGQMHNYLRMLWGKKILEWSPSPREALAAMIELNDRFALDGRDPNSYSGIGWCLGRFDRAWGPERPIFGKIRYMSSANTARKVSVKDYLRRYGPD
jgi:deoxyribodipyrimidine photo-lyase